MAAAMFAAASGITTAQSARNDISIAGSSTGYPFATVVVVQFGKTTKYKTPTVESTGSGGGMKLFCAGVGVQYPDITNYFYVKATHVEVIPGVMGYLSDLPVKMPGGDEGYLTDRGLIPIPVEERKKFAADARDPMAM